MQILTDATQINLSYLKEELENKRSVTFSREIDWTPESQVVGITFGRKDREPTVRIEIQHDQVIEVVVSDYVVTTYLPNDTEWQVYGVEPDELDFEATVVEQIMRDIVQAFN